MWLRAIAALTGACALLIGNASAETYRLQYNVAMLGGLELGTASFEVSDTPTRYNISASVRTIGVARLFDDTDIVATTSGVVSAQGLAWTRYEIAHAYAGKFRRTRLDRAVGVVTSEVTPAHSDLGDPSASAAHQRASYDPLSALFALGRQVGASRTCRGSVLVFDGRQHYRLAVSGIGVQAEFAAGNYQGPAVTCEFRYEPIAGFDLTEEERARIPVGEAVFALQPQAAFAAPLRLSVPTPIGAAVVEIRDYQHTP